MKNIQLIASDIDGTLLLNGSQALDPEIFNLIHQLKQKGILFMVASGREYTNLRNLFSSVADDIAYLCLNGCVTFYKGEESKLLCAFNKHCQKPCNYCR